MSNTTPLPNPLTPLAFFPPDVAFQTGVAHYILAGTMGALVWDTLNTLRQDYLLLTRCRINLLTTIYYISRVATFIFMLCTTIISTAPAGERGCHRLQIACQVGYPLAVSMTALLFFFRVRAMYRDKKPVVAFFSILWLGVVGGNIVPALFAMSHYTTLGPTKYCIDIAVITAADSAGLWITLGNDTLIFGAITWRLVQNSVAEVTVRNTFRAMLFGEYLPSFSRALLQDGQAYFLSTIIIPFVTIIIFYNPSVPLAYRGTFPVPNVMIINIMATRIYRNTKLGVFRELNSTSSTTIKAARPQWDNTKSLSIMAFQVNVSRRASAYREPVDNRSLNPSESSC